MSDNSNILASTDHYDASSVFDDVLDAQPQASRADQLRAARVIVKQAQKSRLAPPMMMVEKSDSVFGTVDSSDALAEILGVLGDDSVKPKPFTPVDSPDFPVTQQLHRKFKAALPTVKVVRVDTYETYLEFCDSQSAPYMAKLADAVQDDDSTELDDDSDDDVMGDGADQAAFQAINGGTPIKLSLPPGTDQHVRCWQDGNKVCCSIRMPGTDGKARIATTSTPIEKHYEEVLCYANDAGLDPVEVLPIVQEMARVLAGGSLVTQLSQAWPTLVAQPEVVLGQSYTAKVTPVSDPAVAAIMALIQLAQQGNAAAKSEVVKLQAMPGSQKLFAAAQASFTQAQKGQS